MADCPECTRLRGESALAFSEYTARKDELVMTRKSDKSFAMKRRAMELAEGQLSESIKRERKHRRDAYSE